MNMKALFFFRFNLCVYLFVITLSTSVACSCGWITPEHFCRSASETNHIVLGVVVESQQWYSMDIEVIEEIHLQSNADTLSILGQDGLNCGEWLENFSIGDTLVLALYRGDFFDAVDNNPFEWHLGNCGLFYLRYNNGRVEGGIDFGEESQVYEDFKSNVISCIDLTSAANDFQDKVSLQVLPIPTTGYVDVIVDGSNANTYSFDLLDIAGNVLLLDIIITDANKSIDLTNVDSGIYFLRSKNTSNVTIKRIIKI